ncbi:phosphatase PAP2 family protein [Brevibacillus daliensis]|uniref:phosphatase PAP2 family protein n=1 Tax=Brevibacillus daliensis TaxID=2892995 RepID=UPI001E51851A|nr:phosphatase PAP2 family protein [Brevibacillus daliensis]
MKWHQIGLPTKRYLLISTMILLFFVFIFDRFADELIEHELNKFDQSIINWVQGYITPQLTTIMKIFTFFGSTTALLLLLVISITLMIWQKKRWEPLFLVIAISGGVLFNQLLKWVFHRQRPTIHRLVEETGYSFPSGHSMVSFIFYGMLWMLLYMFLVSRFPKVISTLISIILILMIGVSRIYLGVHYPSDVIAGFAAGGIWLVICLMGLRLVLEYRRINHNGSK